MKDTLQKAEEIISKATHSFIGSVDSEGYPNTKAMLKVRKREGLHTFLFSTNTSSMRVAQFRGNPKACLYFYLPKKFEGVMLVGRMEVLLDDAIRRDIWQLGDRLYYPKGVTDPDYCVLRFRAAKGRLYSNLHSDDFVVPGGIVLEKEQPAAGTLGEAKAQREDVRPLCEAPKPACEACQFCQCPACANAADSTDYKK